MFKRGSAPRFLGRAQLSGQCGDLESGQGLDLAVDLSGPWIADREGGNGAGRLHDGTPRDGYDP